MAELTPDDPRRLARSTDPDTSHEAAEAVAATAERRRREVLREVRAAGANGAMCGDVADAMGVPMHYVSSRLTELRRAGLIVAQGRRRGDSGRRQIVYVAAEFADALPGDLDLARHDEISEGET